jgi:hypothetical protein
MSHIKILSPYFSDRKFEWLKGNLHTHTTRSDGLPTAAAMTRHYAGLGYDFLGLSDHDVLSDYRNVDPAGLLLIPGNEISVNGSHVLDVGARMLVAPDPDRQNVVDQIRRESGMAVLCHPNWQEQFNHYSFETLLDLSGYTGIEIFNGGCLEHSGSAWALDKWDRLLSAGRTAWGFANDDAHCTEQVGRGWNVVQVRQRTVPAILEALREGRFYASTGVRIERIVCTDNTIEVVAPNADAIAVIGDYGSRLHYEEGPKLVFNASDFFASANARFTQYLRVECYGHAQATAWTQPFFITSELHARVKKLIETKPVLHALRSDHAPSLTKTGADAIWEKAEPSSCFHDISTGLDPDVKTEIRAIATPDALCLLVACEEPHLDQIKQNVTAHGDPRLWTDDSIEIFLDVGEQARQYVHIMANAGGFAHAYLHVPNEPRGKKTAAHATPPQPLHFQTMAKRQQNQWLLEIIIPCQNLSTAPKAGDCWGLHVCRNRKIGSNRSFVWAWVGANNHNPSAFGTLQF